MKADPQVGQTGAAFDLRRRLLHSVGMTALEERRIKSMLKDVVVEVLEERQDLLRDALRNSLEDVAMLRAIREGEKSRLTSRQKILQRLARTA